MTQSLLKDLYFAFSGTFINYSHAKLIEFVKSHDGAALSRIAASTTHLVVTTQDFCKPSPKVSQALKKGNIKLVTLDWLMDSISEGKQLDEDHYFPKYQDGVTLPHQIICTVSSSVTDCLNPSNLKRGLASDEEKEDVLDKNSLSADCIKREDEESPRKKAKKDPCVPTDPFVGMSNSTAKVYIDDEGTVWDVALNQTNIGHNNNKFYFIQLIQHVQKPERFACFTRWGRVGDNGDFRMTAWLDFEKAKKAFESKFKSKTKNNWADRGDFQTFPGKYTLLERDYGEEEEEVEQKSNVKEEEIIPDSNLDLRVQNLMEMIFDREMMEQQLRSLNFNPDKMPLGKLKKSTITDGYNALKEIAEVLALENGATLHRKEIEHLSNKFYTVVPHDFGRSIPPLINSHSLLKQKLELVESLSEIQVAESLWSSCKAPRDADGNIFNPIDAHFNSLKLNHLTPVEHHTEEFKLINNYVKNTHGETHSGYTLEVLEAFQLERSTEPERWLEGGCDKIGNRKLLWHGSRLSNFVGILSQGLRIAPPEAPVTGYMFGKGVYFADCVSKSANYCFADYGRSEVLMLLCEVALGDVLPLYSAAYDAGAQVKKAKKNSTLGVGRMEPNPNGAVTMEDGVQVPCGKVEEKQDQAVLDQVELHYNEVLNINIYSASDCFID
ncbi:hypothetical protein K7432_009695 [Basidiobolus ranarum]|uniref:Poly [ADP-ribose] polymerase n=1 Tax=Basidiobolus ranarum TaxID=34480 RepID=A0ABR2VWS8_9FUNG